jgi:NAD(P)-dependent dehydrogenase (short-subunit alcohol dehydrogenase family)
MPSLKPINRQTIVLTGASSGIGLATAERAARKGAKLMIASRNGEELQRIAERLSKRFNTEVEPFALDVADADAVLALKDAAITRFGGFDSWVNDAAAATYGKVTEVTPEDHRRVFEVGYWGTVQGSLAAAAHLKQRGGALVNLGSILSERSVNLQGPYCAMKHAVKGFTDTLRMELAVDAPNVSVTLIKRAGINTPYPEHARNYLDQPVRIPPVLYDPRLVAKAILHACETPTRELTVGGTGWLIEKFGNLAPTAADKFTEAFGRALQTTRQLPPVARVDNLFRPREDGAIESSGNYFVRRTSLMLEAQMHPAVAAIGGIAAAGAGLALAGLGVARRGR